MGSGGMKRRRKKTKHLPKVGTPGEVAYAEHEKQREVFRTGHGRGVGVWVWIGVVALIVAMLWFFAVAFLFR